MRGPRSIGRLRFGRSDQPVKASAGKTFETLNPATGDVLAKVAACGSEDVDLAVTKARDAFEDGRWSRLHPKERKETLIRLAKLVKRNARELAVSATKAACDSEDLLLLDDTVAIHRLSLRRDDEGVLRLHRIYDFEYSDTGNDRRTGTVTMLGHAVEILHVRPHLYVIPNNHETLH